MNIKSIVIYGYSKTSLEVATILENQNTEYLLVAADALQVLEADKQGHNVKMLDLTKKDDLIKAGITNGVSTLFCMHHEYNRNLFVTLAARHMDKDLIIISRSTVLNDEIKMKLAGANHVVNPYDLGAHRIFRLIRKPMVFNLLDNMIFSNIDIKIDEVKVDENSSVVGVDFQKLTLENDYNIVLLGVQSGARNGKFYYNTHKIYRKIRAKDTLVVTGSAKDIKRLKKGLKP
jgi:voltage-gated potassium channel